MNITINAPFGQVREHMIEAITANLGCVSKEERVLTGYPLDIIKSFNRILKEKDIPRVIIIHSTVLTDNQKKGIISNMGLLRSFTTEYLTLLFVEESL